MLLPRDMASRVGRVLPYLTRCSKAQQPYSQLIRRNLYCWGSTNQGRQLSLKLLGFSLSLVGVGVGVQVINNNNKQSEEEGNSSPLPASLSRIIYFQRTLSKGSGSPIWAVNQTPFFNISRGSLVLEWNPFRTHTQTCKKDRRTLSSIGSLLWTYCRLLFTPASCEGSDYGECPPPNSECRSADLICSCRPICPSDCDQIRRKCEECGTKPAFGADRAVACTQTEQSDQPKSQKYSANGEPEVQRPPKISSEFDLSKIPSKYKTTSGATPVSNNRCKASYSNCSRASDPGIDVDALSKEFGGAKQIDWSMESELSHCMLMRQASQLAVDAVSRIITESMSAYDDYNSEYMRTLDVMMALLEESRRACGPDVEVIECKIILVRAKLDDMKRKLQEVDCFLMSLEKLSFSTAETAFLSHAEYASVAMSERLNSMVAEVKRLRLQSKEKERDMLQLQSLIIVETGRGLK